MADKEVATLSDNQLRDRLMSFPGQDVPPITQSTRKVMERRLIKLMGAGTPSSKSSNSAGISSNSTPKSSTTATAPSRVSTGAKRTPSPTIAPLSRPVVKPVSPRKSTRSGAAFSSDEDEEVVDATPISSGQRNVNAGNATAGTPLRGNLNGRFFAGWGRYGPAASTDVPSSSSKSSLGNWLRPTPHTSTPQERRAGQPVQDSFGSVTPIRDDTGAYRRSNLGRPSLASFGTYHDDSPTSKKAGWFDRLKRDPIHLTPQSTFTRHSPPRPRPLEFLSGSSIREEGNWFSRNAAALLWGLVILFFLGAALLYVQRKWVSTDLETSIIRYKLDRTSEADNFFQCAEDAASRPDSLCYQPEEIINSLDMAGALSKQLAQLKGGALCEGTGKTRFTVSEARRFAVDAVPKGDSRDFTRAVHLIVANPHWGIRGLDDNGKLATKKEDVREFESEFAYKNLACRLKEAVASMLFKILLAILGAATLAGAIKYVYHFLDRRSQRQEQIYEMVNHIIGTVQSNYNAAKKEGRAVTWSIVSHVREELLPHGAARKHLLSIWKDAVDYINAHESRISLDIQQVNGEDFEVWNWLPVKSEKTEVDSPAAPPSNAAVQSSATVNGMGRVLPKPRARFWGGGPIPAKSIMPENITAATPCLKVRGMFDGREENQNDVGSWSTEITDAILERCHGIARIYDIAVEPSSDEGVVYIKLATNEDARNAYMALHGQFFADRNVLVKFLKLERYHHRFPESVNKTTPLSPSKHKRW